METLLMIPGLCSDATVWRRTIAALDGKVDCLVGDTLSDGTLEGMARRVLAQAPDRFALAGVSMGGMVALEIMRIAARRVTRLALIDTSARPDSLGRGVYRRLANLYVGVTSDFQRTAERNLKSLVHPSTPEDVRGELVGMSVRVGPQAYIRQNLAIIARRDLRPVLPTIDIPTMVVVGKEDRLTPVHLSYEMQNLVRESKLHVIPDCGHLPPIEKPRHMAALLSALVTHGH
jgi:pimeloyl-ACP methyl ester carboxylesterase